MHDETLKKDILADGDLQGKYILETTRAIAKHFNVTEDKAMIALGLSMRHSDEFAAAKFIILELEALAKTPIAKMLEDEKQALLAVGLLVRKLPPFQSSTKKIGRNDPCPCESGLKFKACCLTVAKANEVERYKNGGK